MGARVDARALVADVLVVDGEGLGPGDVGRARMDHHRGVQSVEGAAVEHEDLPAAAFLGGRAENGDGEPELVGNVGQPGGRANCRRGDDVVPARVAQPGQRVGEPGTGPVLLPGDLSMGMDAVAEFEQLAGGGCDPGSGPAPGSHWSPGTP